MTHINTSNNSLFTPSRYQTLEGQINEIKNFLNTLVSANSSSSSSDSTSVINGKTLTQHIEEILQRLAILEGADLDNVLSNGPKAEVNSGLEKIEELIDSIVNEIIGPEPIISYNDDLDKYVLTDIQKTIIERINEVIDKINIITDTLNTLPTGNVQISFVNNLTLIEKLPTVTSSGTVTTPAFMKKFDISLRGINFGHLDDPSSSNPTPNESKDIFIENGLRFLVTPGNKPTLIIRQPGIYSSSADSIGICPSDIILHFGTDYIPNEPETSDESVTDD
jgi:hypothetical protein